MYNLLIITCCWLWFWVMPSADKAFEKYKVEFLDEYWKLNPGSAAANGLVEFDSLLVAPTAANFNSEVQTYEKMLRKLKKFAPKDLSPANQTDYALIENTLTASIWYLTEFKSHEWNPSNYNIAGSVDLMLNNQDKPLEDNLLRISSFLDKVPAFYTAAYANIKKPTAEHTQLAIAQLRGGLSILTDMLPTETQKASTAKFSEQQKQRLNQRTEKAVAEINRFADWLETEILPQAKDSTQGRSFRIGEALYNKKFEYDIASGYSAREMYHIALNEKAAIHKKLFGITDQLWHKYMGDTPRPDDKLEGVRQLIATVAQKHVHRDSFITAIEAQLPVLAEFVREKDLLFLDPSKPLQVRRTPAYMEGVAGASISSPGPFEKKRPTYYNVTPLDGYTDEQAESYLREYNHYMLQILNIHEALPGHYAQLVYSNKSPSLIKSIFGNGAMVEGWACYTERMMLEEGYGAAEQPELWLMYYKWNLRIVCNTILDYSVHVLGMTQEDAMNLLTQEAFQEKAEAASKWRRATLSQVQLCSYFSGLTEIYNLREELKGKLGKEFRLKQFHEDFLGYGSAPVREIRKLLFNKWKLQLPNTPTMPARTPRG